MRSDEPLDLRFIGLAAVTWAGCLGGHLIGPRWLLVGLLALSILIGVTTFRGRLTPWGAVAALLVLAGAVLAFARADVVDADRLTSVVGEGGHLVGRGVLASDPVLRQGDFGDYTLVRLRLDAVRVGGGWRAARAPLLAFCTAEWADVPLGSRVEVSGTFGTSDDRGLAGVLSVRRAPTVVAGPPAILRGAEVVRDGIREAASKSNTSARDLVPALVVGDDADLAQSVVDDFRTSGLTHLTAVSGTNLTLIVGFLIVLARGIGVRGRWLTVVGGLGVLGFVLVARPEPSVLRAAVMGSIALIGMWSGGVNRGVRSLGAAAVILLLIDPWLALSIGFALSALATAGILLIAPSVSAGLASWMPRGLADALAVPFAAQLACTPLVAVISGQVSVVAVVANLLAGVVVGPATVLGFLGGLLVLVVPTAGYAVGRLACWSADWILLVAGRSADLPGAALDWGSGTGPTVLLLALCAGGAVLAPRLARRPRSLAALSVLAVVFLVHPFRLGWSPDGWVLVACDVGQGDGLVLRVGEHSAVVVDVGPEPRLMDDCLDELGIDEIPLLVLTHFHADHVDGLGAVVEDRAVGEIWTSGTALPAPGAAYVARVAAAARIPISVPDFGTDITLGTAQAGVRLQVVSPGSAPDPNVVDDGLGSTPNNASLVLVADTGSIRFLLTGDVEPEAQHDLAEILTGQSFDVLKVPHHGSAHQDLGFLTSFGARVAIVSVGLDNGYGHPDPALLRALEESGMTIARTDLDGAVAVVWNEGLRLVRRRR
jgi:competence protein ComEC